MRKSDADLFAVEMAVGIVLAVIMFLLCIVMLCLPRRTGRPELSELKDQSVIVEKLRYIYGGPRTSGHYELTTEDGTEYNVSGSYLTAELTEALVQGMEAEIKYYENSFFHKKYAEVVQVDGNVIEEYNNDEDTWIIYVIAGLCGAIGIGALIFASKASKEWQRCQKKSSSKRKRKKKSRHK